MIHYIGKCLLIEEDVGKKKEKVLVVGDIHLGYGRRRIGGINIDKHLFDEMILDFEKIFEEAGKLGKIVLLGDLKHGFSGLGEDERYGLVNLFDYLEKKCKEIIIIKGNHDNYLVNIAGKRGIRVYDFYIWQRYCFVHGDRDFPALYDKKIKGWIMGHLHPVISLKEGVKSERYKCFLEGVYKRKKVIILPSFIEMGEGIDIRNGKSNLAWDFNLGGFMAKIVGGEGSVLDFGRVKDLGNY